MVASALPPEGPCPVALEPSSPCGDKVPRGRRELQAPQRLVLVCTTFPDTMEYLPHFYTFSAFDFEEFANSSGLKNLLNVSLFFFWSVKFLCLSLLCYHLAELIMSGGLSTQHVTILSSCPRKPMGVGGRMLPASPPSSSPVLRSAWDLVRFGAGRAGRACVLGFFEW